MITNKECEIVATKALLKGLNEYYINLVKISKDPKYRSDLTEEIERVKTEIKINNQKLIS